MTYRIHDIDDYHHTRDYAVRKEIAEFAIQMEIEMTKKNEKYKSKDRMQYYLGRLIEHLDEEREKVDFEIDSFIIKEKFDSFNINTELVHEAILCMIVRNKIMKINKE